MKLKGILLLMGIAIVAISFAQPPRGQFNPEERVKRQTEQMVEDLKLDDAQTVKVKALNEKYSEKMSEAFQGAAGDRSAMRETMTKIREEKDAELKGILTAEQFKTYQELEKKRNEERRSRMGNRSDGPPSRRGQQRGTGN